MTRRQAPDILRRRARLGPLELAVLSTFAAGRVYTRNDIMNRLADRGVKAKREEIERVVTYLVELRIVTAERNGSNGIKESFYSISMAFA